MCVCGAGGGGGRREAEGREWRPNGRVCGGGGGAREKLKDEDEDPTDGGEREVKGRG